MFIVSVGCVGLGLVWGWLTGMLAGRGPVSLVKGLILTLAAFLLGTLVYLVTDAQRLGLFLFAEAFSLWSHLAWLGHLRSRASCESASLTH